MIKDFNIRKLYYCLISFLPAIFISCTTIDYISYSNPNLNTIRDSNNNINIITYNIKAIYEKDKNEIDNLMDYINQEKFNLVIFQELFNESTRDYIIKNTNKNHFITFIARVNYNSFPEFIFQDAELYLMSS